MNELREILNGTLLNDQSLWFGPLLLFYFVGTCLIFGSVKKIGDLVNK